MFLAEINFGTPKFDREKAIDLAESYVGMLIHHGQLANTYFLRDQNFPILGYVALLRPDALGLRYHSSWAKKKRKEVERNFGKVPTLKLLEKPERTPFPSWKKSELLYLFTTMFDIGSPLHAYNYSYTVPVFQIPIKQNDRQYLLDWAESYRAHDKIWIDSGALEMQAYKQLADPNSELSGIGREHCADIEKATGIPTYYYLMRYYGRQRNEETRYCPGCGKKWNRKTNSKNVETHFGEIDFQCKGCRLVSHIASSIEDERKARIGEYRKSKTSGK